MLRAFETFAGVFRGNNKCDGRALGTSPGARAVVEPLESRAMFAAGPADGLQGAWELAGPSLRMAVTLARPSLARTNPADGATNVPRDTSVSADLRLPNGGINPVTLTSANAYLVRASDGRRVAARLNTSAGGDVIVLKPLAPLEARTRYTFVVTAGLKDARGVSFVPVRRPFTTSAAGINLTSRIGFKKVPLPTATGQYFLGLTFGPDGRLYAGTTRGQIFRWDLRADGTLSSPRVIDTVRKAEGRDRFLIGMAFDPACTAHNPVLWVSHTAASGLSLGANGADWTGKISRLSGPDLGRIQHKVIHLPRSVRDHLTNQLAFGPDGALYFCQASNTAMGAPDAAWGRRPERLLSAAILRLDVRRLGGATLDAHTEDHSPYNPYAPGAPLTLYATGVRNAYDLVWHSNGRLYAAGNGSAAGGATPAGPGVPGIARVNDAETDFLFRIDRGGYYGHPNPLRREYVLNGGNPTAGHDPFEVRQYPVGTRPDPRWRPAVFDFGPHQSPNGIIEYRNGSAFGGALKGKLLVARYSGGDDVVALSIGPDGRVTKSQAGIPGLTGFNNPLDLVEHRPTGNLYLIEFDGRKITLLRPR